MPAYNTLWPFQLAHSACSILLYIYYVIRKNHLPGAVGLHVLGQLLTFQWWLVHGCQALLIEPLFYLTGLVPTVVCIYCGIPIVSEVFAVNAAVVPVFYFVLERGGVSPCDADWQLPFNADVIYRARQYTTLIAMAITFCVLVGLRFVAQAGRRNEATQILAEKIVDKMASLDIRGAKLLKPEHPTSLEHQLFLIVDKMEQYKPFLPAHLLAELAPAGDSYDDEQDLHEFEDDDWQVGVATSVPVGAAAAGLPAAATTEPIIAQPILVDQQEDEVILMAAAVPEDSMPTVDRPKQPNNNNKPNKTVSTKDTTTNKPSAAYLAQPEIVPPGDVDMAAAGKIDNTQLLQCRLRTRDITLLQLRLSNLYKMFNIPNISHNLKSTPTGSPTTPNSPLTPEVDLLSLQRVHSRCLHVISKVATKFKGTPIWVNGEMITLGWNLGGVENAQHSEAGCGCAVSLIQELTPLSIEVECSLTRRSAIFGTNGTRTQQYFHIIGTAPTILQNLNTLHKSITNNTNSETENKHHHTNNFIGNVPNVLVCQELQQYAKACSEMQGYRFLPHFVPTGCVDEPAYFMTAA
eukprot:TRINITY_DN66325_c4_g1_i2.p1 TRINITY_DN66325_c4_g1~~TRINITY_DN66325_c4_g1_i2.p1  ORF type:complete len:671 (+),score=53.78 TRINITY_DN66325_c4_g1_i2:288-2015(+)